MGAGSGVYGGWPCLSTSTSKAKAAVHTCERFFLIGPFKVVKPTLNWSQAFWWHSK